MNMIHYNENKEDLKMPVLIVLVLIAAGVLFVLLSPLFGKIGDIIYRWWDRTFGEEDENTKEDDKKNG